MAVFDELYVRFFKSAVQCELNCAAEQMDMGMLLTKEEYRFWAGEARAWGRAAAALRPYMSRSRIASLEGAVMHGAWTLDVEGNVRPRDVA